METSTIGIPAQHDFDEGSIDDVHFGLTITVGKVHFFSPDNGRLIGQIGWHNPVQGDVGEWSLCSPTAWGVDSKDKGFYALLYLIIGEFVHFDKWC
ncbi:hypothetical protein SDC9_144052 [bioreactor metagenome]|uniref:Uncharacterized protein n=1 Tax=bioreactor metagenome TaxID=1076179 RepID=A0A645E5T9_9ZZZZ